MTTIINLFAPSLAGISYELIYLRKRVKTLKHNSGNKIMLLWDGKDDNGEPVADGIYFYLMHSGSQKTTGKFIRVK